MTLYGKNYIFLGECDSPINVTLSSVYDPNRPAWKCFDGKETGGEHEVCPTKEERYPFLVLEYDNPVKVSEVVVYNRDDCCGDRLKNLHVIVTDQYPEVGKMAEGLFDLTYIYSIWCIWCNCAST